MHRTNIHFTKTYYYPKIWKSHATPFVNEKCHNGWLIHSRSLWCLGYLLVKGWNLCQVYKCMHHISTVVLKIEVTCHLSPLLVTSWRGLLVHLMPCLHFASTRTSTRICRTGFSRRSCPMSWLRFLDTAAPKAKGKAKVKAKFKVKAKAAGKAKAAASKAPGVTSSPMKAQKAKAKSTMKKILKRPDMTWCSWRRKPRPKRRLSRRWQQDGKRPGMSQFLMTMQGEKMRSL